MDEGDIFSIAEAHYQARRKNPPFKIALDYYDFKINISKETEATVFIHKGKITKIVVHFPDGSNLKVVPA